MKNFPIFLQTHFEIRKTKNKSYSLRAFARDLEISASTLSRVLSGKLTPTADLMIQVIQKLGLSKIQESKALSQFATQGFNPSQEIENKYQEYSEEEMLQQNSWEFSGILESFNLDKPPKTILEISRATGIDKNKVDEKIRILEKLGMVKRTEKGWRPMQSRYKTSLDKKESIRKVIQEYFELAIVSMNEDPLESRRISGTTAAIDPDRLPEAFQMLSDFRVQLIDFLTSGKRKEIYRLNLSLAPIKRNKA